MSHVTSFQSAYVHSFRWEVGGRSALHVSRCGFCRSMPRMYLSTVRVCKKTASKLDLRFNRKRQGWLSVGDAFQTRRKSHVPEVVGCRRDWSLSSLGERLERASAGSMGVSNESTAQ